MGLAVKINLLNFHVAWMCAPHVLHTSIPHIPYHAGTDLDKSGEMTFSVIEVANSMGWESHIVRSELSGLQYNDQRDSGHSRSRV